MLRRWIGMNDWNGVAGVEQAAVRHGDAVIVAFAGGSARRLRRDKLADLVWDPAGGR